MDFRIPIFQKGVCEGEGNMKVIPIEKYKENIGQFPVCKLDKKARSRRSVFKDNKYLQAVLSIYLILWISLSWSVTDRADWFVENLILFVFFPVLIFTYKWIRLSNTSYTLIAVFFLLHIFGSKFTYSMTPVDWLINKYTGEARNNYDRIVHFSYGVLLMWPFYEATRLTMKIKGWKAIFVAALIITASGAVYEMIEMTVAMIVNPELGTMFVGAQGDEWDSVKDMTMQFVGSILFVVYYAISNVFQNRKAKLVSSSNAVLK